MANVAEAVEQILSAVKAAYPGWQNLDDPTFIKDEVTYKRNAVEKASQLLGKEEYSRLLREGAHEEIRTRLKAFANATNLLYRSQPSTSDISILTGPESEFTELAREIYGLLYGEGESSERLEKFSDFEKGRGYRATWPFPTYLLFLLNPGSDFFVKPTVVQWLLEVAGASFQYVSKPSGEFYRSLLALLGEIRRGLVEKGISCSDMVDLQSLIWVAHQQSKTNVEHREFLDLWGQFRKEYLETGKGERHLEQNRKAREEARAVYRKALEEEKAGTSITETVIRGFLPYKDSKNNLEGGYWCSPTPVFNTDIRAFFAGKGWNWDWDAFAKDLFDFVKETLENPISLEKNCRRFLGKGYKGLQGASLSPILNALAPENFLVVNIKPLKTLERFGKKVHAQTIEEYARTNEDLFSLYRDWADLGVLEGIDTDLLPWSDYFDIFCHWLMAEKNYFDTKFWKIAPGRNAEFWEEWKRDGIVSVGWSDFGDLSSVKKKADFDRIAEEYLKRHPEDTRIGISQVWKFINSVKIGDRVLANEGTRKALGIGTVTGKYLYEPKYLYSHVIPVIWDDLGQRSVTEPSWVKTLIELPRDKFEAIEKAASAEPSVSRNYNEVSERLRSYYPDGEDLQRICSIFAEAVEKAHGESPSGWCTTLLNDRLRLNVGRAATLDCLPGKLRISVLVGDLPNGTREKWEDFKNTFFSFNSLDEKTTGYDLPCGQVAIDEEQIRKLLDSFIAKAASRVKKTPYGAFHEPRILDAVSEVLQTPLPSPEYGEISGAGKSFSPRAFNLLEMLLVRPEVGTYLEHLGDYEREVEAPVKQLVEKVAASLGEEIKDTLETEKDLFSRIPKKEGQKGGVWPHYGGAFYPKGSSRGEGLQLYLLLTHEGLRAGLSFGEGRIEEKSRFERNLRSYGNKLMEILAPRWQTPLLATEKNGRESREAIPFLLQWISEPEKMGGCRLARFWEKEELIETEQEDLAREIQTLFTDLFPFVLLALTEEPMAAIGEWYGIVQPISLPPKTRPSYALNEVAEKTGYPLNLLERWKRSLLRKKQAVFYGPPGTGKTFVAKEMARHLVGGGKGSFEVVQFHPSYAYEDFIEGIRPAVRGETNLVYEEKPGTFLEFCDKAAKADGDPCVLIVDEINRAPLSRVFGELMYLLEYRGETVNLASGRKFSIPENVFLIGTMNTADRSIALVDHALRRRFAFISLFPRSDVLTHFHMRHATGFYLDGLVGMLEKLNKAIGDPNFSIGVSFFMRQNLAEELEDIWRMEIEPYLEEYFYEKNGMIDDFRWEKIRPSVFPKEP